jgi:hypothetical protein
MKHRKSVSIGGREQKADAPVALACENLAFCSGLVRKKSESLPSSR